MPRPVNQASVAARVLAEAGPTLSVRETATVFGVSSDLVRAMHRRGELDGLGIRVLRLGSRIRISTASLRRAIQVDDTPLDADGGGADSRPRTA
jgi:hypothetical protein